MICGYWAIGNDISAMPPVKVMTTDTTVAKIHRDFEDLKKRAVQKTLEALVKIDSRFKSITVADVLDANLRQAEISSAGGGPNTDIVDSDGGLRRLRPPITIGFEHMDAAEAIALAGELSKMAEAGFTEEQVRMVKQSGRSLFAEAYVANRASGESRRSFTYAR